MTSIRIDVISYAFKSSTLAMVADPVTLRIPSIAHLMYIFTGSEMSLRFRLRPLDNVAG